jgi:three-Cys-motif partner protein
MASSNHFEDYTNLQRVKHELVRRYVNGWLPKLATGRFAQSKVIYFDTHAGRGSFSTGEKGSPIVALSAIQNHRCMPDVNGEIRCVFIEKDEDNVAALESEILELGPLPENCTVQVSHADSIADPLANCGKKRH